MAKIAYDLVVATGEYTDKSGAVKKRWLTIGKVFATNNGYFAILDRHISLAGLPTSDKGDGVMVSFFEPRQSGASTGALPTTIAPSKSNADPDFDSDVPF